LKNYGKKNLPEVVEKIIYGDSKRDKTRVVTYNIPFHHICQVYDYESKRTRIIIGPDLTMLGPDEQFTLYTLSGSTPKRKGVVKTITIDTGDIKTTDIIKVETSDNLKYSVTVTYSWFFDYERDNPDDIEKIFRVDDFIGELCSALGGRIRGYVSQQTSQNFNSDRSMIRKAIFGVDENGRVRSHFKFNSNNMSVTNADVVSVEPVDDSGLSSNYVPIIQGLQEQVKIMQEQIKVLQEQVWALQSSK